MGNIYYGIDIGGTEIKLGAFDSTGTLLGKWHLPTDLSDNGARILPSVADFIRHTAQENGWRMDSVAAAGVGVPGPVQRTGYVERCVNLHWEKFNPAEELAQLLHGIPVVAGNDANVAAMGEYWQGSGKGYNSVMFITLGTGVGSGIIIDGRMLYGAKGLGGEIGHTVINPDEPLRCNCGHYGCLDQMASATGIVRNAQRVLSRSSAPSLLRNKPDFTCRDVFDAAKQGDSLAEQAVDYCLGFLGRSISMASYIVDPDVFIIGGGVSRAGQYLIDKVYKVYDGYSTLADGRADIVLAKLGNDAGIYGAAKLALDAASA